MAITKKSKGMIQRGRCREVFLSGTAADVIGEWRRPTAVFQSKPYEAIRDWLLANLSEQLAMVPNEMDIREPFTSYGLDSQRAVVLSGDLQDWLGRPLAATLAYDFPSIDALARHLSAGISAGRENSSVPEFQA